MRHSWLLTALLIALGAATSAATAQVALEGYFIPLQACEATKKKDRDNPGNVRVEIRRAYDAVARNATPGTHYQIRVPGAPVTESRWVPMTCGDFAPAASLTRAPHGGGGGVPSQVLAPNSIEHVLAASWQPAFCATAAGKNKRECLSQTATRFDATHFALHGLWPDDLDDKAIFPCYCDRGAPIGCNQSQDRDRSIALSDEVRQRLAVAMPGMQSGLELHEWPKHGACYEDDKTGPDAGATPDEYFTEAIAALDALNASAVQRLFADRLGQLLSRTEIEAAFDADFGAGASTRVQIRCAKVGGENIISELWISMKGEIGQPADLGALIQAAPPIAKSTNDVSCSGGRVVKVSR